MAPAADPITEDHDPNASASASDTDFAPSSAEEGSAAGGKDDAASSSDSEAAAGDADSSHLARRKRKRGADGAAREEDEELASGDEATIQRGRDRLERKRRRKEEKSKAAGDGKTSKMKKKKRKGHHKSKGKDGEEEEGDESGYSAITSDDEDGDDEGPRDGGAVRTRAQRREEKQIRHSKRYLVPSGQTTADIDAVWAAMTSLGVGGHHRHESVLDSSLSGNAIADASLPNGDDNDDMITITRTYNFAGKVSTETRRVPRSSAEARLWLSQQQQKDKSGTASKQATEEEQLGAEKAETTDATEDKSKEEDERKQPLRRPPRRPSRFDANPSGDIKSLPPHHQVHWRRPLLSTTVNNNNKASTTISPRKKTEQQHKSKQQKPGTLNTVEKSRLDWAGYVDQEGIQEELEDYGKGKEGYLGRMDFLERSRGRWMSGGAGGSEAAPS